MGNVYLKQIFTDQTIIVNATYGVETFVSSGFFTDGGVHGLVLPAGRERTLRTSVNVYEQIARGKWCSIFESLGKTRLCWKNQSQVLQYCRDHGEKLQADEYGTAFELEGGLIAFIEKTYGGFDVIVHKSHDFWMNWPVEYRIRYAVLQDMIQEG